MKLQVIHGFEQEKAMNREAARRMSPEERLDLVEQLRIIAGKMGFHEYPTRLRRVFVSTPKASR